MRFYVKRSRCVIYTVFILLLISLSLTACIQPENPDLSHIEGTECPDEKILEHIEKDFTDFMYKDVDPELVDHDRFQMMHCYGTYDGCVPAMFSGFVVTQAHRQVEIAGSVIRYGDSNSIYVWKDGDFVLIEDAYAQGWLTAEQIATIADIHNNGKFLRLEIDYT